ncbi:uncharacterized protein LOC143525905 isoform X2 [Brachyhypopomus gauderio]|uniref:uncharacterized protein LOC143525905 isoform X2 n=1 Tax=Brachyhypopomus gauderio TaxID=698409 RepID=UPI0040414537
MNLYRSFGCLLETWVAEGYPATAFLNGGSESQLDANDSYSRSSEPVRLGGIPLRSESEDSGVELPSVASAQSPLASTPISEDLIPLAQAAEDKSASSSSEDKSPSSSSPAPSLCSSSSSCFFRGAEGLVESPVAAGGAVEQALRRTKPAWKQATVKDSAVSQSATGDSTRQRSNTLSSFRTYHRTGKAPRDQQGPAVNHRRTHTTLQHAHSTTDLAEAACDTESSMSPGLLYLEQVCQVMQEMARLQQLNQRLQMEVESLRDRRRETERESACLQKGEIKCTVIDRLELWGVEEQPDSSSPVFRRRTVSDTRAFLRQDNRAKLSKSGQFTSTNILLEEPETIQPAGETKMRKVSSSLKLKISSLRRNEKSKPAGRDSSQSEKTTSLRQLFRNRRRSTRL